MMRRTRTLLPALALLALAAVNTSGQWCNPAHLRNPADLMAEMQVIDARPSEINKVRGKNAFRKQAQVAVVNMNPFLYRYDLGVKQDLIPDKAFLDFIKLLGPPITDIAGVAAFRALAASEEADEIKSTGNLARLIVLTGGSPVVPPAPPFAAVIPGTCSANNAAEARQALTYLAETRDEMLNKKIAVDAAMVAAKASYTAVRGVYNVQQGVIYSPSSTDVQLCTAANALMPALYTPAAGKTYPDQRNVNALKALIADMDTLIRELNNSATAFKEDAQYNDCRPRYKGFNYVDSLIKLAAAMAEYRAGMEKRSQAMLDETKAYDFLVEVIKTFQDSAGGAGPGIKLLQNSFVIDARYDISAVQTTLTRNELQPPRAVDLSEVDAFRAQIRKEDAAGRSGFEQFAVRSLPGGGTATVVGDVQGDVDANGVRFVATSTRVSQPRRTREREAFFAQADAGEDAGGNDSGGGGNGGGTTVAANQTVAPSTIGARRFELSGGITYAWLPRYEFKPVLGYARNAQGEIVDAEGKPTGERKLSSIVGRTQSSGRRFAPLAMLHTRLTDNPRYNLFFSTSVTAKHDQAGTDIEYMIGPSFNFLNNNMFFTFGGYAGRQQRLAGDLFEGAALGSVTDVPVRKDYVWKPAFSFTYRIPLGDSSRPRN
ncbi:MAG: hypothetical protein QOD28_82 [Acidobacteriota bacterium]|nr:hypothetical protein [Acidobacteriota bacterium]